MPSPRGSSRERDESTTLLSSTDHDPDSNDIEHAENGTAGSSKPRRVTWRTRLWSDIGSTHAVEESSTLPLHNEAKVKKEVQWGRMGAYVLVFIVGLGMGAWVTSGWRTSQAQPSRKPEMPTMPIFPPPSGLPRPEAFLMRGENGAVASEEVTCSNLGLSILRDRNGTAVDAAVTTTLCIGVLNAFSAGIGGGGFMVVRVPEDSDLPGPKEREAGVWAIDFREMSPAKSEKEMYGVKKAGRIAAQFGGLAIGIPGELRGLEMAHDLYGSLPWADLVMPVAQLARGWTVSRELARRLRVFGHFMLDSPTWTEVYAPRGELLVEGEFIQRLNYARTLEKIAKEGASSFYEGDIAQSSVKTIVGHGGVISMDDLRGYKALRYPAIHQTYHGKTIYTTSVPSSGGVMLGMFNLLEPYNLQESGCFDSHLNTHRFIEAQKFAFGARSEITDPAFSPAPSRFDEFYSKQWADEIRPLITDNTTHDYNYYGLVHDAPIDHGTTHLSVLDQWGGAASITTTVNLIWGSRVMDPETGIIFNDEQDDFAIPGAPDAFGLQPSPYNYPAPGKRPLSSTAATIVLNDDGSLYAILGGSGGSRIFGAIAQTYLNLECGLNISAAIERPKVHNQVIPQMTTVEVGPEGEDKALTKALEDRGHEVLLFDINMAVAEIQGIVVEDGTIWAASDSRKHGVAAAY